ncbi:MAG: hypothetical protein H0T65_08130, partial [Deltaproteobacteria bacterium]|nr:hypothetical protein [Deltaproteobacteria bacterium]
PIALDRTAALIALAVAACTEAQTEFGVDTAIGRPTTCYRIAVLQAMTNVVHACRHAINHYDPYPLEPAFSAFLTALREATGPMPQTASAAWDRAATWMHPRDLGPLFHAGQPVPLPSIVSTFVDDGIVFVRAGQPPLRSELYRLDPGELVWLPDNREPVPLTMYGGHRWVLPCGGGVIETHDRWQQPRMIYVRVDDPARGIYVQRA